MILRPLPHRIKSGNNGTETKIPDLPVQVLTEIFDLFQPSARQKLRSVCHTWNYIIGQLFPIALKFDTSEMLIKTDARFIELTITGHLHSKFHNGLLSKYIYVRFRKLELEDTHFKSTHLEILRRATNLEELVLKSVYNFAQNPADFMEKLVKKYEHEIQNWLPALKILKVDNRSCIQVLKLISRIVKNGKLVDFRTESKIYPDDRSPEDDFELELNERARIMQEIIDSNRSTLRTLHGFSTEFDFHTRQTDKTSIYRKFAALYFWPILDYTTFSENWFRILRQQRNLETLHMIFFNGYFTGPAAQQLGLAFQIEEVEPIVRLTMGIILGNATALTKVVLTFTVISWFRRVSESQGFDGVFSSCVSLKHLHLVIMFQESDLDRQPPLNFSYKPEQPGFTGLTTLPKSLNSLNLSFPILCTTPGLRELQLPNLENLESLCMDPCVWFIFTGTGERINRLSINHVKQLKSKLPKLKQMALNVANHGTREFMTGELTECKLVTPGLLNRYKKTLQHDPMCGVFLEINF